MKTKIFVYGSLKYGFVSHELIAVLGGQFVCSAKTKPEYELHSLGAFPALVDSEEKNGPGVYGEVYDIEMEFIPYIDRYEGVSQGLYERRLIQLSNGMIVSTYIFVHQKLSKDTLIESGIWEQSENSDSLYEIRKNAY